MDSAFVTASISRNAGGIFDSMRYLAQGIFLRGKPIVVLGTQDNYTDSDLPTWDPVPVQTFPIVGPVRFSYAVGLSKALTGYSPDIVHSHSLWNHTSIATYQWHRRTGKPYVVHPHGMLDSWALRNSFIGKFLADLLYERKHLQKAACIRALTEFEARSIRALGLKNPICIIPNGIHLPQSTAKSASAEHSPVNMLAAAGHKVLLYLGRIHPKKNLNNLLRAWSAALKSQSTTRDSWVLAVAGWSENGHESELKRLAEELGITCIRENENSYYKSDLRPSSLLLMGPQFGNAKADCYSKCNAVVLPSLSEGLPMAVLEAWSHGKPVLMTPQCNLPEGFTTGAGIRIETTPDSIQRGLHQLFAMSDSERETMGSAGLKLTVQHFSWSTIAAETCAVSDWVLGGGATPACVQIV